MTEKNADTMVIAKTVNTINAVIVRNLIAIGVSTRDCGEEKNMGRMIDADALIDKYGDWYTEEGNEEGYIGTIKGIVNKMPTIEERKQGKWIDKGVIPNYPEEGFNIYHLLVCDQCGCMHRATVWCVNGKYINADFCPNCGALMR